MLKGHLALVSKVFQACLCALSNRHWQLRSSRVLFRIRLSLSIVDREYED